MLDETIKSEVDAHAAAFENHLNVDSLYYYGQIHPNYLQHFRNFVEEKEPTRDTLAFFLNTTGGSVETAEKMVTIIRNHYAKVYFIIPSRAMSAGTIMAMSGDKIYMDYYSSLGPIDPQVLIETNGVETYVPALGYLEQFEKLIEKSKNGVLTPAEFVLMQAQDLAMLHRYEQAKELSIQLLEEWLAKYKFKDWHTHSTTNPGSPVTPDQKKARAKEIASHLNDISRWYSHDRMIGIEVIKKELKLQIEDYTNEQELKQLIRKYHDLLTSYLEFRRIGYYLH